MDFSLCRRGKNVPEMSNEEKFFSTQVAGASLGLACDAVTSINP